MSNTPKADNLVAEFLTAYPEHADEFGYHTELGPIMTTKGTKLFVEWAIATGRTTKEKGDKLAALMSRDLSASVNERDYPPIEEGAATMTHHPINLNLDPCTLITSATMSSLGIHVSVERLVTLTVENGGQSVWEGKVAPRIEPGDIGWGKALQQAEVLQERLPVLLNGHRLESVDQRINGTWLMEQYCFVPAEAMPEPNLIVEVRK